jgi:ribosomal protein L11 methylase PrmA
LTGLIFTLQIHSQENKTANEVKKALIEVFELCKNSDDKKLSKHIVYRGDEEKRIWKDVYDSENKNELEQVKSIRLQISSYLQNEYKFVNFIEDKQSEGTWYVWEMEFNKRPVIFAFLKINDHFAIGDID